MARAALGEIRYEAERTAGAELTPDGALAELTPADPAELTPAELN